MGSVILCGLIRSAPLPLLSPNLENPIPVSEIVDGKNVQNCVTISAGIFVFIFRLDFFSMFC